MSQILIDKWANGVHTQQIKKIANSRYFVNNYNPATHFIEVWTDGKKSFTDDLARFYDLDLYTAITEDMNCKTIAIFKIRAK